MKKNDQSNKKHNKNKSVMDNSMINKNYVFVYGTLKKNYNNHVYILNSDFIDNGIIKGYALYVYLLPYAIKTNNKKDFIKGELYKVNDYDLKILDSLENGYKKIKDNVKLNNGSVISAYIYILDKSVNNEY